MDPIPNKAILIDMTHPEFQQVGLDIAGLHQQQVGFLSSPSVKQSRDATEMLFRTRDLPQEWLESKSWYPSAVLAGPIDLDHTELEPHNSDVPDDQRKVINPGLNWCVDIWGLVSKLNYDSVEERRAAWAMGLPQ